ncbi:bifunctional folylpolyglutamate synthase/dihydrofolate synthase [Corynebacterium mayonis]|uniref:bifunctional folylpolyglutamate synthase/dihydrofolate synthase n=1 Tax=Corynebacterium mayonis TaxID=3062461 RepID=UPI00314072AE
MAREDELRAARENLRFQLGDEGVEGLEELGGDKEAIDSEFGRLCVTEHGLTLNLTQQPDESEAGEETFATPEPTQQELAQLAQVVADLDQRAGATDPNPSLDRICTLMELLGEPQKSFNVILVAGTNGKTSTARMIDALLRTLNRRVGLFISPELNSILECVSIDGEEITPRDFLRVYREIEPYVEMVDERFDGAMSRFEVLVGLAYAAFADAPVEVAVVEVGMGGTWDATNCVDADVSVIAPISHDHSAWLGNDIEKIAAHKAGIIGKTSTAGGTIAVVGRQEPEAMEVILRRAVEVDAIVARLGSEFGVADNRLAVGGRMLELQGLGGTYSEVFLPLAGAHQADNASLALAAVEAFFGATGARPLDLAAVRAAFGSLSAPGRLERLPGDPAVFIDVTHNVAGAKALVETLESDFDFSRVIGVVSLPRDKDVRGIMQILAGGMSEIIVTRNFSPRAMETQELAAIAVEIAGDEKVYTAHDVAAAVALAKDLAQDNQDNEVGSTAIVVTGSHDTAGEARRVV